MARERITPPTAALLIVVALGGLPFLLWRAVLRDELASFQWRLSYFVELTPWALLLAGICFLVPVALSAGGDPESRWYPRGRRAYFVWGIVLYVMGAALSVEVFDVWSFAH